MCGELAGFVDVSVIVVPVYFLWMLGASCRSCDGMEFGNSRASRRLGKGLPDRFNFVILQLIHPGPPVLRLRPHCVPHIPLASRSG